MPRDTGTTGPRCAVGGGTGEEPADICGDRGRPDLPDGDARGGACAGRTSRLAAVSVAEDDPSHSPPLSPEEIAIFEAIASGAEKTYRVSESEFARIINGHARPKAHA